MINRKKKAILITSIFVISLFSVSINIVAEYENEDWEKLAFPTSVMLENLTDLWNITWSGNSSWAAVFNPLPVYCNSSGIRNETMIINLTVNMTHKIGWIKVFMGDVINTTYGWMHNASNLTIWVSGNETGPYMKPLCNIGNGLGVYLDGGANITLNATTCFGMADDPFMYHGDGFNITTNCSIYVRFQYNYTIDMGYGFYYYACPWVVYIGTGIDMYDFKTYNGMLQNGYEYLSECCLDTSTTVWNGSAWVKWYNATQAGDEVRFNVSFHNCGRVLTENIAVFTYAYDALKYYIPGTGTIIYPGNSLVAIEPVLENVESDSCDYPAHSHLTWHIENANLTNFTYCNYIYLEYNMSVNTSNYSRNNVGVYVCPFAYDWWDATCYNTSDCFVNEEFNKSIICGCNQSEKSDWVISEHIHRECTNGQCYDELWHDYETQYYVWSSHNQTLDNELGVDWGWVLRYNNTNVTTGERIEEDENNLSYTLIDESMNRSTGYMRLRYSCQLLMGSEPFVGFIYSYEDNNNYDMVLYSYVYMALLSKRGGVLMNTNDSSSVNTPNDAYNYYNESWPCNSSEDPSVLDPWVDGIYSKYIYNEYSGHLNVKAWDYDPNIIEPCGWMIDEKILSLEKTNSTCFGLVIWNPTNYTFVADFDMINDWKLNYTLNASHPLHNETYGLNTATPYMYFKAQNYTEYNNEMTNWFFGVLFKFWFLGTMPFMDFLDESFAYFRNFTRGYNLESKYSHPPTVDCSYSDLYDNQNDSVYYYTSILTNKTAYPYKNEILIHIEDATDGTDDTDDSALVAIDVDNDHIWGDNDKVLHWYYDSWSGATWYNIYNGTTLWKNGQDGMDPEVYATFSASYPNNSLYWPMGYNSLLPSLHRYDYHRMYDCTIPLYYLEKNNAGSGVYLSENDTFGLHIMTIPFDNRPAYLYPDVAIVWENYNETTDDTLLGDILPNTINESDMSTWNLYMNITDVGELGDFWFAGLWNGVTNEEMQYWGHGKLGSETGWITETVWDISVNKTCNITILPNTEIDNNVWFNVSVFNSGEQVITNLTVNDTFDAGIIYVDCNLPPANVTNPSDNTFIFNLTQQLLPGQWYNITIHVLIPPGNFSNGSYIYNFVNVTNNESANGTSNCSFKYGLNSLPTVLWQYPANGNLTTPLLLANISVGVVEPEGTAMTIIFSSNKTDTWTNSWSDIGTNVSVGNGTYMSNQTFNNSQRYNTKWRWGYTVYYWSVSVTDLIGWTNETYYFRTSGSRYDIDTSGDVTVSDLTMTWNNRALDYLGIYDVDNSGDITVSDLTVIWAHH